MGRIQIVAIAVSLLLLVGVLELVRRRKLTEDTRFSGSRALSRS